MSADDLSVAQHAEAERIDQRVAFIRRVEINLAGHGGDSEAVAVVCDARHHPAKQAAVVGDGRSRFPGGGDRSEPQRVGGAYRPRTHSENVAHNASHAGGGTLERLDGAGVIVRLDFEGDGQAVPDVEDARVFLAGAHQDPGRLGGEGLEQRAGVFVGAMLAPHH